MPDDLENHAGETTSANYKRTDLALAA